MAESTIAPLLTPDQVAALLGIPKRTLYVQRSEGRPTPPAIRVGKHLRYRQSDIDAWLDSQADDRPVA